MNSPASYPEKLLHFIWNYQLFHLGKLKTTKGLSVEIINPGTLNDDSGPDFLLASIKIDQIIWGGSVEIHWKTSQWDQHGHQHDAAYEGVILHVVWEDDLIQESSIPIICLNKIVPISVLERHHILMSDQSDKPCQSDLSHIPQPLYLDWLEQLMVLRVKEKAHQMGFSHDKKVPDLRHVWMKAFLSAMGFRLNKIPMEHLSELLHPSIIHKYQGMKDEMEILIMGCSGLLSMPNDTWSRLKSLHQLHSMDPVFWKRMRTRPGNHPEKRLKQAVMHLAHHGPQIPLQNEMTAKEWEIWLASSGAFSKDAIYHLLINAVAPTLAWFALNSGFPVYIQKALDIYRHVPTENNREIRKWIQIGMRPEHGGHSQALPYLYRHFCRKRRCLECPWGRFFLSQPTISVNRSSF